MLKYLIIVEGKTDIIFLKDYLMFLDTTLEITKKLDRNNKKEIVLKSKSTEIKILIAGGYTAIKEEKLSTKILEYIDSEYKILVIQDADCETKADGGVQNRMKYLDEVQKDRNIKFETFLFPNNKDDGDLEILLLQIKNTTQYDNFFECYDKYIKCIIESTNKNFISELRENKNKVFNYFSTYYGMENSKEENRVYDEKYWDLNNKTLDPLKTFMTSQIISDNTYE